MNKNVPIVYVRTLVADFVCHSLVTDMVELLQEIVVNHGADTYMDYDLDYDDMLSVKVWKDVPENASQQSERLYIEKLQRDRYYQNCLAVVQEYERNNK